jgi:hypothetical protein
MIPFSYFVSFNRVRRIPVVMKCQLTRPKVAVYVPERTLRDIVAPQIVFLGIDVSALLFVA